MATTTFHVDALSSKRVKATRRARIDDSGARYVAFGCYMLQVRRLP